MEADAVFGARWVDTDTRIKLSLCHATLEADSNSLCDLTSIRASYVESDNLVICLVDQYLGVCSSHDALRSILPFEGPESGMVGCNLFFTESLLCLNFG